MNNQVWHSVVDKIVRDFCESCKFIPYEINPSDVVTEFLDAPHEPPKSLPEGKFAVYIFKYRQCILKVGMIASDRSDPRYTYQHYTGSTGSTLHKSIRSDPDFMKSVNIQDHQIYSFLTNDCDRVNLLIDSGHGRVFTSHFETFVQCRLSPRYEGSISSK